MDQIAKAFHANTLHTKVGFVHFDIAYNEVFCSLVTVGQNGTTDRVDGLKGGNVRITQLLKDLADGEFQFEELDQLQPLSGGMLPPLIHLLLESWKVSRHDMTSSSGADHPSAGTVFEFGTEGNISDGFQGKIPLVFTNN